VEELARTVGISVLGHDFSSEFTFFCVYTHHLTTQELITNGSIVNSTALSCPMPPTT